MTHVPTSGDYAEALQNPTSCFEDPELKAGRVGLTPLGMPRPISGNFASIFSVTGLSGKRYAVKCFTGHVTEQHRRYKAIHAALDGIAKPWKVEFRYIPRGVLVKGEWHAILRMEWVDGSQTLIPWLTQNLSNPHRILDVANQFAAFIADLKRAGIAHGDLQHGNLLVDSQQNLRVIDYDGMFVPDIRGLGSNELGLANYQHPQRSSGDFGPQLDRFSAWVIYGSLLSVATMPDLWWTMREDGDEKLILGKDDFSLPLNAIDGLRRHGSPLAEFADVLKECLASPSSLAVPEFDPRRLPLSFGTAATPPAPASTSDWWRQRTGSPRFSTIPASGQQYATPRGTDWLQTHRPPPPPIDVAGPGLATKAMGLVLTTIAILGAGFAGINTFLGSLILLTWATAMVAGVTTAWNRSDAGAGRAAAIRKIALASQQIDRHSRRSSQAKNVRATLDSAEREALRDIANQRARFTAARAAEVESQSRGLRNKDTELQRAISKLDADKAAEFARKLNAVQGQHIQDQMAKRRIEAGAIPGIGPALIRKLAAHGLRTAADFAGFRGAEFHRTGSNSWLTVTGIGPEAASRIQSWHSRQKTRAQRTAPKKLTTAQTQALEIRYADLRKQMQAAIDAIPPQLKLVHANIDAKYANLEREFIQKADAIRRDYNKQRSICDAAVARATAELTKHENALLDAQRELDRYRKVSLLAYLKA